MSNALPAPSSPSRQSGVMLLEVLIAVLIFSVGVLSIVQLHAVSVKQSTDAEFRTTASLLASDLVSRMWTSDRSLTALQSAFASDSQGSGYEDWYASVKASGLPNADQKANQPKVTIKDSAALPGAAEVEIELFWQLPGKDEARHAYLTVVVLK